MGKPKIPEKTHGSECECFCCQMRDCVAGLMEDHEEREKSCHTCGKVNDCRLIAGCIYAVLCRDEAKDMWEPKAKPQEPDRVAGPPWYQVFPMKLMTTYKKYWLYFGEWESNGKPQAGVCAELADIGHGKIEYAIEGTGYDYETLAKMIRDDIDRDEKPQEPEYCCEDFRVAVEDKVLEPNRLTGLAWLMQYPDRSKVPTCGIGHCPWCGTKL